MGADYIDWFDIKDPHPAALANIQAAVDHMMKIGATNKFTPISLYALAKSLGKQQKQITQLLRDRPGFVRVEYNGKSRGYYYDYVNFGHVYPAIYGLLRTKTNLLAVEELERAVREEQHETVSEFRERMPAMAKELAAKVDEEVIARVTPDYPQWDFSLPNQPKAQVLITFSPRANASADLFEYITMLRDSRPGAGQQFHSQTEAWLRIILASILTDRAKKEEGDV